MSKVVFMSRLRFLAMIGLVAFGSLSLIAPTPAFAQSAVPGGTVQLTPRQALAAKLSSVSFVAMPMNDVCDWIRETLGTNVHVNWGALQEVGVEPTHPISLQLKMISVDRLLRLMLQETGAGDQLTFYVDGNVLEITTKELADAELFTRVYPIQDLLLIPSTVSQPSTGVLSNGGSNSSRELGSGSSSSSSNTGFGSSGGGSDILQNNNGGGQNNGQGSDADRAQQIVDLIKKSVPAEMWEENGGRATITVFRGNLILTAPRSVHEIIGGPILNSSDTPSKE